MHRHSAAIGAIITVLVIAAGAGFAPARAGAPAAAPPSQAADGGPRVAPGSDAKAGAAQPPVQISADAAEYFNKEGFVVFTGNVVAVEADSTITAERMEVFFEQPATTAAKPATGIGAPARAQRITRVVALNKVSLRQLDAESGKERYATGEKGVYDVDQRLVTLTGNPRLWEGKNVIVGEEMVFHLDEKKVVVKGKVNLTVFPDDVKEEKKP